MLDEKIEKTFEEAMEILNSKAVQKLESHLFSLYRRMEQITISRESWKRKYIELKNIRKDSKK